MPLTRFQSQYAGVDRQPIWDALFAHLQAELGSHFVTMSQKHIMPPRLVAEQQPALFQVQMRERRGKTQGLPTTLTLTGFLILYLPAPQYGEGTDNPTAITFNTLFKAIDDALVPDNASTGTFTLGGLVQDCWIDGDVEQDPGIFTTQAAAIVPIHILVP